MKVAYNWAIQTKSTETGFTLTLRIPTDYTRMGDDDCIDRRI